MPQRFAAVLLLAASLVLANACGAASRRADAVPAATGTASELPRYTLRTVDGQSMRLADHIGKDVILLSFWATWCKPCRGEFPFLQELHERHADKGLLVLVVSIDGPETQSQVRPFLRRNGYTMPAVIDRDGRIAAQLNPRSAVPLGLVFDRTGRRHRTYEGFQLGERDVLEAELLRLLGGPDAVGGDGAESGADDDDTGDD